jgi:hypothetical protein
VSLHSTLVLPHNTFDWDRWMDILAQMAWSSIQLWGGWMWGDM